MPTPVVASTKGATLADHMDLANLPLASTPGGRAFALKALHPADPTLKATRAPGSVLPSVAVACDMVDTIPFPPNATSAAVIQWAHAQFPMCVVFYGADGNHVEHWVWPNAAIASAAGNTSTRPLRNVTTWSNYTQLYDGLDDHIEGYRVTAQSITCDVIAPAVANQGTIVSAQFEKRPSTKNTSFFLFNADQSAVTQVVNGCDMWAYNSMPDVSQLMMGTSAYTAKAEAGFYQPLKINKFKWVNVNDQMVPIIDPANDVLLLKQSLNISNYPIYFGNSALTAASGTILKPSCHVMGVTFIEGTAGNPQVSLRIRFRQVTEIRPRMGGRYAPLAEAPLPPDELAFKMVCEIGARMKDAYPASYNDVGKLKDTIVKIGRGILKFADPVLDVLGLIPGVGSIASAGKLGIGLLKGVDQLASRSSTQEQRKAARQTIAENSAAIAQAVERGARSYARRRRGGRKKKNVPPPRRLTGMELVPYTGK